MIIDYSYYSSHGGNKIPQNVFDKYSIIASGIIKRDIMNRDYSDYLELVQKTAMQIIDLVYDRENLKTYERSSAMGTTGTMTNEKVGDYSVTYASYGVNEISNVLLSYNDEIESIIEDNLLFTGLLNKAIGVIR